MEKWVIDRTVHALDKKEITVPISPGGRVIDIRQEFPNVAVLVANRFSGETVREYCGLRRIRIVRTGEFFDLPPDARYVGSVVHLATTFCFFDVGI